MAAEGFTVPYTTRLTHPAKSRMARFERRQGEGIFRTTPSGAFDQYLQDIQKLPLIKDPAEERRLARSSAARG